MKLLQMFTLVRYQKQIDSIPEDSISSAKLTSNSVTTAKIADDKCYKC